MLSGEVSLAIPGVAKIMDKLDAMKAKFLAVPANTRAALDKLARVRMEINKGGNVPPEINTAGQLVETNLKRVQSEWAAAADRFTLLENLRRGQSNISTDQLMVASQLFQSATYVMKNADSSIAAVDRMATQYLTPAQREALNIATVGVGGGSLLPLLAIAGIGALMLRRSR